MPARPQPEDEQPALVRTPLPKTRACRRWAPAGLLMASCSGYPASGVAYSVPHETSSGGDVPGQLPGTTDSSEAVTETAPIPGATTGESAPYEGPARYPADRVHSPLTPFVVDRLRDYAERTVEPREDVFAKVGASSTASAHALTCFDPASQANLGIHPHLADALAYFDGGDASGTTPFGRTSLAAESGRSAAWAIEGDPSPLARELAAVAPRWALVHFGTNDMNLGVTYGSAMIPFYDAMIEMVDDLLADGIVPIVLGITRRGDNASAQLWVPAYNAMLRGMAQSRQIPFVDLYAAIDPLPGHGLGDDGVHLNRFDAGACLLTADGLQFGYNARNLVALEALDRVMQVVVGDAPALDDVPPALEGIGSWDAPFVVDGFPFAHRGDTREASVAEIDVYPPCDGADESGPEVRYRLSLEAAAGLRVLVLDHGTVDVDVHLVEADGDGDACLARGHHRIEGTVPQGDWDIVVDTFASGPDVFAGEYLLVIVRCDAGDEACAGQL